jgi:hypothetical protein
MSLTWQHDITLIHNNVKNTSILAIRKTKNPIKDDDYNHHKEDKREGQKMHRPQNPKKGEN